MAKKEIKNTKKQEVLPLKNMTVAELSSKAKQLSADITKKKLDKSVGRLKNVREIFNLRKELARVKTFITIKS
jgi:ribosomal protein L29